ncbi:MAG: cyclic nucleotide-binding domain-containing protein [Treponema sp.]|nr:cyclic nucleotide-binding domain-containing protein [Treponema sp.]
MGVFGVINSDPQVKKRIDDAAKAEATKQYIPRYLIQKDEILEFLNYDLPEIVLINFSDPGIDIDDIVSCFKNDKWLLNFGIIGIFSGENHNEESYLEKYKSINILAMMDVSRLRSHLIKNIQIIEQNYQIIFQREFSRDFLDGSSGSFTIENDILAIPLYAGIGATIVAQRGLISPDHKMQLQLSLGELIVNAVEHGNCGISYDEKTIGMENGLSVVELVAEKCRDPAIRKKKVELLWDIQKDQTSFIIRDEGKGFDVKAHLKKIENLDQMSLHGRGIRIASIFSTKLKYNDKGNEVTLILKHDDTVEHEVPSGFSREQVINVKAGDLVIRENDPSDYLYYIISGNYSVYHKSKKVGSLSPQDIFMGEIAFLINQRRSASVRADGQGKLVPLSRKALVTIIREYPHYGIFLSRLLARRLVRANDQTAALSEQLQKKFSAQTIKNI